MSKTSVGKRTVSERQRETPIMAEVDVVVAGGGPAGLAAAVAAARSGVDVLLIERHGYLGGLATGGLVLAFVETERYGSGICKEIIDQLLELGNATLNKSGDEAPRWIRGASLSGGGSVSFDPEALKLVAVQMITECGADLLLHSLIVDTVTEESQIRGVVIEGKQGRQAILGKVFVDATGDADVAAASGAPFNLDRHPWGITVDFRFSRVNVEKAFRWRRENPEEFRDLMSKLEKDVVRITWSKTEREDTVWGGITPFLDFDGLNIRHLTKIEVESRRRIRTCLEFFRKHLPGFESSFLVDTTTQIGVRETRRIVGEYILTVDDALEGRRFQDAIASSFFDIPYRCLVPLKVENLLIAGRCISTTHEAQGFIRNIPPCLITGQAAGTAAAIGVKERLAPRKIDIHMLRENLRKQGVRINP